MNKKLFLFNILFFSYISFGVIYSMEKKKSSSEKNKSVSAIEPRSPRKWVNSLHSSPRSGNPQFDKLFAEGLEEINAKPPKEQLAIFSAMIERADKLDDYMLMVFFCNQLYRVYNNNFHGTGLEKETKDIIKKIQNLLGKKKLYAAVKMLHFSASGALPPLLLDEVDSNLNSKVLMKDDNSLSFKNEDLLPLDVPILTFEDSEARPLVFSCDSSREAEFFCNNELTIATKDGSIFVFDTVFGSLLLEKKKKIKKKVPILLLDREISLCDKLLSVEYVHPGLSVICSDKKLSAKCLMLNKNRKLVSGYSNGLLAVEDLAKKTAFHFDAQETAITALASLSRFKFVSGAKDGQVKLWDSRISCSIKTLKASSPQSAVNAFTFLGETLLLLSGSKKIETLSLERTNPFCIYRSADCFKTMAGFKDLLIAGLKNGSLRLWHKDEGFGKTALLGLNPPTRLSRMIVFENNLFCFYKSGMIIKFPYEFFIKVFAQANAHNFDSVTNKAPLIILEP